MNKDITLAAVEVLTRLFYEKEVNRKYVSMALMELFYELGVFNNVENVVKAMDERQAWALLNKLKLFDFVLAEEIEKQLRGN